VITRRCGCVYYTGNRVLRAPCSGLSDLWAAHRIALADRTRARAECATRRVIEAAAARVNRLTRAMLRHDRECRK